jgi:hypothetical protein
LAVLLVVTILVLKLRQASSNTSGAAGKLTEVNRNRGFDRRVSFLEYTKHARCRMECREITETEVQDIMKNGSINYRKSNVKTNPCPTYAVEGYTQDAQHVRIVFAQCDQKTKVVTCIDLEKDWQCHCPGDDDKYQTKER